MLSRVTVQARVLIVCETPAVRLLLQQALDRAGCTSIAIEDCAAAARLGEIDAPHLILLDEHGFRIDGASFQALVDRFPDAIVAALAGPVRNRDCTIPAADCLLEKPVDERALLRAVAWSLALQDPGESGAGPARQLVS